MNTIREKIYDQLIAHGLWPKEAEVVLVEVEKQHEEMRGRWEEPTDAYPPTLVPVLWFSVKRIAAQWLTENKPGHFARVMFELRRNY